MTSSRTTELVWQLADRDARPQAARALARHLGAAALFAFTMDPELGVLMPAPGFPPTVPDGDSWADFVAECQRIALAPGRGQHQGQLPFPCAESLARATAYIEHGTALVFVGEGFALDDAGELALPLVGALLSAEQASVASAGAAAAAAEAARHASALACALDGARADLEAALAEQQRGEEERRRLLCDSEAANRAKDEFLAMLGHELRNPLAPIVTALQLIKMRGDGDFDREHEVIERQIEHLIRLVDDLLDISRITRGKVKLSKAPVELGSVVHKAVEMASPLIEQRMHRLTVSVAEEGLLLCADGGRLAQVISNLLTNAARYTPPHGMIRVEAARTETEVVMRVVDSGMGIEPEILPRIFDLFQQGSRSLDRAEGGLGLGLALVRTLVTMHEGTVSAHSEGRDRGSEFVVRLPAMRGATEVTTPGTTEARSTRPLDATAQLRVLVVDDNADAAELIEEGLRMRGHEVAVAYDAVSALEAFERFDPDVAILDIGLPVMDGYELARRLRRRPAARRTSLIAVTGYGQPADRARAMEAGFDRHMVKPVDLGQLLEAIDEVYRVA